MITRDAHLIENGVPTVDMLRSVIKEFQTDASRRDRLHAYYEGKHDIETRSRRTGDPNNKLCHDFPGYIVSMASAYLAGNAIGYADTKQEDALAAVLDAYKRVSIDSVDSELAADASVYGKGVEIVYAGRDSNPHASTLDPRCAFCVYDDTVEHAPLFGVHWYDHIGPGGTKDGIRANVYTALACYPYSGANIDSLASNGDEEAHRFGDVPIIEYWNNARERGDFEPVLSLIDAYDILESDRINDKQQFVDAIMVFYGVAAAMDNTTPDDPRPAAQKLREDRALFFPEYDRNRFEWATKQLTETDVEILKNAIKSDIHKFSLVPDLTDEKFAGNASGVAMKYKLLGLEQLTKVKERWFREGLRWRLQLFAHFLAIKGAPALDPNSVNMTFTRSLPVNEAELAETVKNLQGIVPDEILLKLLPFISDTKAAMEMLIKQKEDEVKRQQKLLGGPNPYPNEDDDENEAEEGTDEES